MVLIVLFVDTAFLLDHNLGQEAIRFRPRVDDFIRRKIAEHLGREDDWLPPELLRRVAFRYSLTERSNGDCIFLSRQADGKRTCSIYPVRPRQCRTWPFWRYNVSTPDDWLMAGERCPGVNRGARLFSAEEIEERVEETES